MSVLHYRLAYYQILVKVISKNLKQGNNKLEGFEYGHVFFLIIIPPL